MEKIKIKKVVPIVYCGSLIQNNYGETVSKHGYLLWDVKTLTYQEKDIETTHGFYQFQIESLDDLENGNLKCVNL